jgi:hypothetical protein
MPKTFGRLFCSLFAQFSAAVALPHFGWQYFWSRRVVIYNFPQISQVFSVGVFFGRAFLDLL